MSAKERIRKTEITVLKDTVRQSATIFYKICALKLVNIKMQMKTGAWAHVMTWRACERNSLLVALPSSLPF